MEEKREYPMTVWPGSVVPTPLLLVPQARLVKREVLAFGTTVKPDEDEVDAHVAELPPEFYLREFLELDASDADAVLAFCQRWGPVGRWDCTDLPNLPYAGRFAQDADAFMPHPWSMRLAPDPEGRLRSMRRAGLRQLTGAHSVKRVGIYQDTLHNMVLLWRFIVGDIDAAGVADEARPAGAPYLGMRYEDLPSMDVGRASFDLVNQINPALLPFHVRLELHLNRFVPVGTPLPNLYEASCLQLANHVAEHAVYRRCANETCGRLFVRQRGGSKIAHERGAEQGQYHSSGVLYCTPQCARAQAARASRRRRAQRAPEGQPS